VVEFALVAPLFLALLLMFMQAGFSAMEKMNSVNVTDTSARIASSAAGSTSSETAALQVVESMVPRLKAGRVGTSVTFRPNTRCHPLPKGVSTFATRSRRWGVAVGWSWCRCGVNRG
jgi:Flp pilus assembly protein TadG